VKLRERVWSEWKAEHPKRRAANIAVGNAVRDGKLTSLPCVCCGEKAEAHHPDYDRPLDVVWLCSAHHKQAHALVKNGVAPSGVSGVTAPPISFQPESTTLGD